jgi:hypothetical protein
MKSNTAKKLLVTTTMVAATAITGSNALGQTASTIESDPSGTLVNYNAIVSAILSVAGTTIDGYTYNNNSYLAADSTGSIDIFAKSTATPYVPALGDAISVSGTYSPFDGIPEIGTITSVTLNSSGNPYAGPTVATIPYIQASLPNLPANVGEYLVTLDNVTISNPNSVALTPGQTFATHANTTLEVTDGSGNSMVLYQWASSYSTEGALGGTVIPTGAQDITGFVDVFSGANEFVPLSFQAVPEPANFGLIGAGAMALVALVRRQSVKR